MCLHTFITATKSLFYTLSKTVTEIAIGKLKELRMQFWILKKLRFRLFWESSVIVSNS